MKLRIQTLLTICLFISATLLAGCSDDENSTGPDIDNDVPLSEAISDSLNSDLSVLSETIQNLGLAAQLDTLRDATLFAPTDSAFADLPDDLTDQQLIDIIRYHISTQLNSSEDLGGQAPFAIPTAQGDSIYVRNRNAVDLNHTTAITEPDISASGNFIHKIDEVLMPDSFLNSFQVARKRFHLSKFTCSCTTGDTGLASELRSSNNDYTVFAPTDEAFENLGSELGMNVEDLPAMELRATLSYHIIKGQRLTSADLTDGMELTTLNGATLTVSVGEDGLVTLNNGESTVEVTNIEGTNGVVHEIDTVLTPPEGGHGGM